MKKFFLILTLVLTSCLSVFAEDYFATTYDDYTTGSDYAAADNNFIDDYIDMARIYTSSANYKKALEYIDVIDKMSPNNPKILYEKAVILKNYNQPILARNLMREVATLAPEYKESYLYKEFFKEDLPGFYTPKEYDADYYVKRGLDALSENKSEKAIEYLKKALELNNSVENLNNLGVAYLKSNMPQQALKCFQKVLLIDAQNADAYLNLGIYYTDVEPDEKKQLSYLKKSIKFNSKNASPFYLLGNYYDKKNMPDTAIEYYRLALTKDDTDTDIYYALGKDLYKIQKYDEAYSVFEKSLSIELDSATAYEYLAKIAIALNKTDEAESYIRKAVQINPTQENYLLLVKALYNNRKYQSCLEVLNSKIANAKNSEMYNYIGLCNFQTGNYTNAIRNFLKAVSVEPKPSYYYNLAVCYNSLNDKANMQKYIDMAKQTVPRSVQDYLDIMQVYQDLGQNDQLLLTINKALSVYPNERQFYNLKLDILKQLGRLAEYNTFNLSMQEKFKKAPIYTGK